MLPTKVTMNARPYPPMTVPDRPVRNPDTVRAAGEDGWTLFVNPDTAGAMSVNATGVLVWSLVDGKRTTEEIILAVKNHFPNAPDSVRDDVLGCMTKLAIEGFIGQEVPFTIPSAAHPSPAAGHSVPSGDPGG
jgi:hypothetical protein